MSKFVEFYERDHMHDMVGTPRPPAILINAYHIISVTEKDKDHVTLHMTDGTDLVFHGTVIGAKNKLK